MLDAGSGIHAYLEAADSVVERQVEHIFRRHSLQVSDYFRLGGLVAWVRLGSSDESPLTLVVQSVEVESACADKRLMVHHIAELGSPAAPDVLRIGVESDVEARAVSSQVPHRIAASSFEFGR